MLNLFSRGAPARAVLASRVGSPGVVTPMTLARSCISLVLMTAAFTASANNVGENAAWQFQTSADKVNQAAVQDMIQKRKSGYYAAPVYTTNIDRQFNCNVTASALGNDGTNSTIANSPSTTGASSTSVGNDNATQVRGGDGSLADTAQTNTGSVGSFVRGSTNTNVEGWSRQALNSDQRNTGDQSAQVTGSSACAFGTIN
jgi:hypothetical protein